MIAEDAFSTKKADVWTAIPYSTPFSFRILKTREYGGVRYLDNFKMRSEGWTVDSKIVDRTLALLGQTLLFLVLLLIRRGTTPRRKNRKVSGHHRCVSEIITRWVAIRNQGFSDVGVEIPWRILLDIESSIAIQPGPYIDDSIRPPYFSLYGVKNLEMREQELWAGNDSSQRYRATESNYC